MATARRCIENLEVQLNKMANTLELTKIQSVQPSFIPIKEVVLVILKKT